MALTKEMLEEFETKYKRIAHLRGKEDNKGNVPWEVVIRKPTRAEYKQYRSQSHNPAQVPDAQEILARKTCVYPEREAFDALLEDWPGIPEAAGNAFKELLGLSVQEDLK